MSPTSSSFRAHVCSDVGTPSRAPCESQFPVVRREVEAAQQRHGRHHALEDAPRVLLAEEDGGVVHQEGLFAGHGALVSLVGHGAAAAGQPEGRVLPQ